MTLISYFFIEDVPCLVSDCLISRPAVSGAKFNNPLTGEVQVNSEVAHPDGLTFPSGLAQKTLISDANLAIAWAGNVSTATDVIQTIHYENTAEPFTLDRLKAAFSRIPYRAHSEISIVGTFRHSTNRLFCFIW